jgi:hypothetical protein
MITAYGRVGKPLKIEQTDKDTGKLMASKIKKGYSLVSAKLVGLENGLEVPAEFILLSEVVCTDEAKCAADLFPEELRPVVNELAELTRDPWLDGAFHEDDTDGGFIVLADPRGSSAQGGFVGPALDGTLWDMVPDSIMNKAPMPKTSGEGDLMLVAINTRGEICYFLHDEWKNWEEKSHSDGWTYNWRIGCGDYFYELKNYYSYSVDTAESIFNEMGCFGIDTETLSDDGLIELGNLALEAQRIETYNDYFDGLCVGSITVPEFDKEQFLEDYQVKAEILPVEEFVEKLSNWELTRDDTSDMFNVQPQYYTQLYTRETFEQIAKVICDPDMDSGDLDTAKIISKIPRKAEWKKDILSKLRECTETA